MRPLVPRLWPNGWGISTGPAAEKSRVSPVSLEASKVGPTVSVHATPPRPSKTRSAESAHRRIAHLRAPLRNTLPYLVRTESFRGAPRLDRRLADGLFQQPA